MARPMLIYYSILKYQQENLDRLHREFSVIELPDPRFDEPGLLEQAEVILAPLGFYLGKEKMDSAPHLKVIGSNTTGHPHIDVEYAEFRGIRVVTLKGDHDFLQTITPTAEMTWGLLIALTRKLVPAHRSVLEGRWDRRPHGGRNMLSRMKLGVAGLGRLGSMVARYGLCFGMEVSYYDPYVTETDLGIERVDALEDLVGRTDVVSIHIPHEKETENLFNRHVLMKMKPGAYLINTSRGELVDHDALLECLETGLIAGVAMDVFPGEFSTGFDIRKHPLWEYAGKHDNCLITPHIGGSTKDAWRLTELRTIERILEAMNSADGRKNHG